MNLRQPWEDTYSLLTGARIKRTCRPGEQFEGLAHQRESIPLRRFLQRPLRRFFLLIYVTFR